MTERVIADDRIGRAQMCEEGKWIGLEFCTDNVHGR